MPDAASTTQRDAPRTAACREARSWSERSRKRVLTQRCCPHTADLILVTRHEAGVVTFSIILVRWLQTPRLGGWPGPGSGGEHSARVSQHETPPDGVLTSVRLSWPMAQR